MIFEITIQNKNITLPCRISVGRQNIPNVMIKFAVIVFELNKHK